VEAQLQINNNDMAPSRQLTKTFMVSFLILRGLKNLLFTSKFNTLPLSYLPAIKHPKNSFATFQASVPSPIKMLQY